MSLQKVSIFMIEHQMIIPPRSCMVRSLLWSFVALGISLVFLVVSPYLRGRPGVEYSFLYRDANTILGNPLHYGALKKMTSVLLISSGTVLFFTALMG